MVVGNLSGMRTMRKVLIVELRENGSYIRRRNREPMNLPTESGVTEMMLATKHQQKEVSGSCRKGRTGVSCYLWPTTVE